MNEYFLSGNPIDVPANTAVNDTFTMGTVGLTTNPTASCAYQKIANQVQASIPALSGTSNSTTFQLTGVPAAIRPSVARIVPAVQLTNGALAVLGSARVNTDGTIDLFAGLVGTAFSAVLGKGVAAQEISWLV